uniref:ARID domain-containing protein n=1 Tax=Anolis carolinensis TaxID=28377 RepID=H9GBQ3_ANOCA
MAVYQKHSLLMFLPHLWQESPPSKPENASESERKSPAEESGDETVPSSEKEEEQTFLVNLYRFMKDRHTPIERVPHLGFKQINLFKIYKVVEKMGAYELRTTGDCNCRGSGSSEAYKRLFSSFYFKGNHGIMSPLAKKKLLAQVSKDEALCRHLSDCPQYKKPWVHEVPALSPEVSPTIRTSQKVDDGSSRGHPSPSFRGSFYTSRSDIVKPVSCHPIRGPSDGSEEQPEDLRKRPSLSSWRSDSQQPSAFQPSSQRGSSFAPNKTSWVTNLAKVNPQVSKPSGASLPPSLVQKKRALEEDVLRHGKKLKAVSPFVADTESPNGQQGLAKAAVANPCFSAPRAPEMYKGTMLRLPVNFDNAGDRSKGQPPSLIPSLSVSPFLIPAFPTPILTASLQPSDLCHPVASGLIHYPTSYDGAMRQRLYPVSTWHSQPAYATSHIPAYHRNTKL